MAEEKGTPSGTIMPAIEMHDDTSLYDMNKTLSATQQIMTDKEIYKAYDEIIKPFILEHNDNKYFMLLCRERYDFTLFDFYNYSNLTMEVTYNDLYECFINRGDVISVESTASNDAIEIWLRIDNEDYVFYLFPYDLGVIKEGE